MVAGDDSAMFDPPGYTAQEQQQEEGGNGEGPPAQGDEGEEATQPTQTRRRSTAGVFFG